MGAGRGAGGGGRGAVGGGRRDLPTISTYCPFARLFDFTRAPEAFRLPQVYVDFRPRRTGTYSQHWQVTSHSQKDPNAAPHSRKLELVGHVSHTVLSVLLKSNMAVNQYHVTGVSRKGQCGSGNVDILHFWMYLYRPI